MAVCHAVVVTNENPMMAHQSPDRTPWKVVPQEQMRIFRDLHDNSTGCVASEAAIVQGVLGAQVIISGDGWTGPELREARSRFMAMCRSVIEHLHTFGFVIIAVNPVTRLPGVVDPELLQVWHSCTLDGVSHYLLIPTMHGRGLVSDMRPLDGVAVFEVRRPSHNGELNSPLKAALRNFNYTSQLMQAGLQAAMHNARPMVFLQRERKELSAEEKLGSAERGAFGVTTRLVAGADATAAILEDARITRAIGTHEIERTSRHTGGIFVNGTRRDDLSGGMVFGTTLEPNIYDGLQDNQTVAAGPQARAPDDLSEAIRRAEDDIARITQVSSTIWGGTGESGVVQQTVVLHTYLQCLASWRTILGTILDDVCEVCRDGVDTRLLCNRPTGERKDLEDLRDATGTGILPRGTVSDVRPAPSSIHRSTPDELLQQRGRRRPKREEGHGRKHVTFVNDTDANDTEERLHSMAAEIAKKHARGGKTSKKRKRDSTETEARKAKARASDATNDAEVRIADEHVDTGLAKITAGRTSAPSSSSSSDTDDSSSKESSGGGKDGIPPPEEEPPKAEVVASAGLRRGYLHIRFGSAMDVYAIEQMYEQGRLDFDMSQIMLAHLRGIDRGDLTEERLDPMTQRPVAEMAREQQMNEAAQLRAKGAKIPPAAPKKQKKPATGAGQQGRDDIVRTPGRVAGLGDHTPSVRSTLTKRGPGERNAQ